MKIITNYTAAKKSINLFDKMIISLLKKNKKNKNIPTIISTKDNTDNKDITGKHKK
jgi:hypothetical protein